MRRNVTDHIKRLTRVMQRYSSKVNPSSQGRAQGRVLRIIYENEGLCAKDLAAILDIRPSSFTDKLDKLEEDGNVQRVRNRNDMRIVQVYITEKGKEVLRNRMKQKGVVMSDYTDCLSDEENDLFCSFCDRLTNRMEEIVEEEVKKSNLIIMEIKNKTARRMMEDAEEI